MREFLTMFHHNRIKCCPKLKRDIARFEEYGRKASICLEIIINSFSRLDILTHEIVNIEELIKQYSIGVENIVTLTLNNQFDG